MMKQHITCFHSQRDWEFIPPSKDFIRLFKERLLSLQHCQTIVPKTETIISSDEIKTTYVIGTTLVTVLEITQTVKKEDIYHVLIGIMCKERHSANIITDLFAGYRFEHTYEADIRFTVSLAGTIERICLHFLPDTLAQRETYSIIHQMTTTHIEIFLQKPILKQDVLIT